MHGDTEFANIWKGKHKWYNMLYDPTDSYRGKVLINYFLIEKKYAEIFPLQDITPRGVAEKLNIFLIGIRGINPEYLDNVTPRFCSIEMLTPGDDRNNYKSPSGIKV